MLQVTLKKSTIGRPKPQKVIVECLGLGKINRTVKLKDTPQVRGMIRKVEHLVAVEDIATKKKAKPKKKEETVSVAREDVESVNSEKTVEESVA